MTVNVALGVVAPGSAVKTHERGKAQPTGEASFDEALGSRQQKRKPQDARQEHMEAGPSWKTRPPARELARAGEKERPVAAANSEEDTFSLLLEGTLQPETPDRRISPEDEQPSTVDEETVLTVADENPALAILQAPAANDDGKALSGKVANEADATTRTEQFRQARQGAPANPPLAVSAETGEQRERGNAAADRQGRQAPQPPPQATADTGDRSAPAARPADEAPEERPRAEATAPRGSTTPPADDTGNRGRSGNPAGPSSPAFQGRVDVVGFSTVASPAPAAIASLNPTAAGLVAAIEAEPGWRPAALDSAFLTGLRNGSQQSGFNTLRIQLHPAELGMVTARLTGTGAQLSIEIEVESNDARQRLTSDSDAIVRALRAVGYDVDKVTIQQAPQNQSAHAQQGASGGREQAQQQLAQDGAGAGGRGEQGTQREGQAGSHGQGETAADRAGGGLYI